MQRFDIAAGPLSAVLTLFQRASGIKVVLGVDSIGMISSPGVTGVFTAADALARLLEGTNVAIRFTAPNVATLDFRVTLESVDVTGTAPRPAVTSPKYTQPLRNVPQTIDVIPQSVMAVQGVRTLSEALRNVPGITMQAGEGGGSSNTSGDMFNMRGFNAANSIFVDGVRDDGLVSRDVFKDGGRGGQQAARGERPGRGAQAEGERGGRPASRAEGDGADPPTPLPENLDRLWMRAEEHLSNWRTITMRLPERPDAPVSFTMNDAQRWNSFARSQLSLDAATADVIRWEPYAGTSRGQKWRGWVRFGHTGELGGIAGQFLAGVASLAGVVLVWTGLALALRRLVGWRLWRRLAEPDRAAAVPAGEPFRN